jgi:hypothetical protein
MHQLKTVGDFLHGGGGGRAQKGQQLEQTLTIRPLVSFCEGKTPKMWLSSATIPPSGTAL